MEWMILPLKRYFEFSGRSRRKEFWMFALLSIVVSIAASIIDSILGFGHSATYAGATGVGASYGSKGPIGALASLALLIPSLAVSFRRLHDVDRSAWWLLLSFIPILGWIVLLVFDCTEGTRGSNRFGPDPKSENLADVFH